MSEELEDPENTTPSPADTPPPALAGNQDADRPGARDVDEETPDSQTETVGAKPEEPANEVGSVRLFLSRHRKPVIGGAIALVIAIVALVLVWWLSPQQLDASSVCSGFEIKHPRDWSVGELESDPDFQVIMQRASGPKVVVGNAPYDGSSSEADMKKAFDEGIEELASAVELPDASLPSPEARKLDDRDCLFTAASTPQGTYAAYGAEFGKVFSTIVVYAPNGITPGMRTTVNGIIDSLSIKATACEVSFEVEGETIQTDEVWDLGGGASVKTPAPPRVDGKAFERWTANAGAEVDAEGGFVIVSNITSDTIVRAEYVPAYKVTFLDADGKQLKVEQVKTGGSVTPPSGPEKAHHKFVKWDTSTSSVTKDLTVKPVYEPVWTVTFTDGNGGVFATVEVDDGGSASISRSPTKDGHTFEGWSAPTSNVKSDITVDPVFKKIPTKGETNALGSALSYLKYMPFSYTGLIKQLEYEKYSHEEAVYAADNCGADWNEQAVKCAKNYLEYMSFSRGGLIDQLVYEGFTQEQATYGVDKVGL